MMVAMVPTLAHAIALAALGFGFGTTLKVSDLLQEHGYRWFGRRGDIPAGLVCTAFALGLLFASPTGHAVFWFAVLVSWILRGRIDGVNHGILAIGMLAFVLSRVSLRESFGLFCFFAIPLCVLGLVHDLLQYTNVPRPRAIGWFFENQHLYWHLIAVAYVVVFDRDVTFVASVWGFVKGYGFFYDEARREKLSRVGIALPSTEPPAS